MGAQRILQAAGLALALATPALAGPDRVRLVVGERPGEPRRERLAVIDLGPDDGGVLRRELLAAAVAGGFEPVLGDGIEDALAGINVDKDAVELAAALAEAQRAFGALDCPAAIAAGERAIAIGAMRQAAGLAVPELPRALTYVLLCRDRAGDVDAAMVAARRLRAVGGSVEVPADVWKKYPDVDTLVDQELVALEVATDVPDASVFVDLRFAGKAPLKLQLPAGEHLIAVAAGTRRGWGSGHTDPKQTKVTIPTIDRAGAGSELAVRVAGWKGKLPPPEELAAVMTQARARVVLIRRGDAVEAWGRVGRSEEPRLLGGDDGIGKATDAEDRRRVVALVADRVRTWNDRAPDPDRPLLVEQPGDRGYSRKDEKAKWWVYAALGGSVLAAAAILYVNQAGSDRQRVELTFP